jgi:hypothetical protein
MLFYIKLSGYLDRQRRKLRNNYSRSLDKIAHINGAVNENYQDILKQLRHSGYSIPAKMERLLQPDGFVKVSKAIYRSLNPEYENREIEGEKLDQVHRDMIDEFRSVNFEKFDDYTRKG